MLFDYDATLELLAGFGEAELRYASLNRQILGEFNDNVMNKIHVEDVYKGGCHTQA